MDEQTDGQTENQMHISHLAKAGATIKRDGNGNMGLHY